MKQVIWIISCYLYGVAAILLVILLLLVYLRGQVNHLPNPFSKKKSCVSAASASKRNPVWQETEPIGLLS